MRRKDEVKEIDFKTLFEAAPGLYLILLPDLRIVAVNDAYAAATMTKRDEILGRGLFEVFPDNPDDPAADGVSKLRYSLDYVRKYKRAHTMAIQKYDIRRPDGTFEERYWSPLNKPVLNGNGEISYIIHRVEDITEFIMLQKDQQAKDKITADLRIRVEEMQAKVILRSKELEKLNAELEAKVEERTSKLAASEKQYRETLNNMLEGVQIIGFDWRYIYVNDSLAKHGRYRKEELIGYTMMQKYPGIEDSELFAVLKKCMVERISQHIENEFVYPDDTRGWFELSIQPVPEGIFILTLDITERKRAEQKIRENMKEISDYKHALDVSAIVAVTNQKGIITHVNDNFCRISGYSAEELIGQDHRIIKSGYHPKEFIKELWSTIAKGEVWKGELKNRAKDGTYYWVDTTIVPFLNEAGKPYQYVAIRSDITERKRASEEIQLLNESLERKVEERTEQLLATNKELEAFSYSVSHDLRAPLRAINGFANILREDYGQLLDAEGNRLLGIVQDNADKMGVLIDDLLAFSRLGRKSVQKTKVDMKRLAETTLQELNKAIRHNARIYVAELHPALSDYTLMNQVFMNLISNAIKYSSKVPVPQIEIKSALKEGEIIYSVKDNGTGFDMQYAHKLFGVFQRLHRVEDFEGTGVGLAIVQRIIHKHGGKVWADAQPGKGATFYFSLPLN